MTPTFPLTHAIDPAGTQDHVDSIQKLALGLCTIDLLIFFSRFFDEFGGAYHLPGFVLLLLIVTSLVTGKSLNGFSNKAGRFMLAFVAWVSVTLVFSIWRSNSIPNYEALLLALVYFAVVSGLVSTLRQVRRIMSTLAVSFLIAALMGFVFRDAQNGERLKLAIGTYHDPNQYAMCLLMGIPLWWFMAASSKTKPVKVLCYLCTLPMFLVFFQTGSRGGILGLAAVILLNFLTASLGKKIVLVAATVIGAIVAVAVMPSYIKMRYQTFFDSSAVDLSSQTDENAFLLKGDMDSEAGRKTLFLKSITMTINNPIFGVGPGNFPTAVFSHARESGEQYAWLVCHNAYTQISSETGIPGLILFVAILFCSVSNLNNVLRVTGPLGARPWPDMWQAASYLRMTLAGTSICMVFLSAGFTPEIYVLAGLTVGLERVLRIEMAKTAPVSVPNPSFSAGFVRQPLVAAPNPQESRWAKPHSL